MLTQDMSAEQLPPSTSDLEINQAILRKRRLWYLLAVILLLLTFLFRHPLTLLAAIFTLLVGIVPEIWFRGALRHLVIRQHIKERHLFFGEKATLFLTIENRKFLPVPWLEVENSIQPPLSVLNEQTSHRQAIRRDSLMSTWLLWSYQRVTRRYHLHCQARGFHLFGPVKLSCSDPFGWMERDIRAEVHETVLVYPLVAPLEVLLPSVHPLGETIGSRHLLEDPLWFAGNREYQVGDDPRRIDWKATARVGELRSKIYESTVNLHMLVVLDTWSYTADIKGVDFDIQEFCISAAASLAMWGLDEGYMVGLLTNSATINETGTMGAAVNSDDIVDTSAEFDHRKAEVTKISAPGVHVPYAQDHEQYMEILTTLARLVPNYHTPIEYILEHEEEMLQQSATLMLVCSVGTLSEATVEHLLDLRARGNVVNLILAGTLPAGQQMVDTYDLPVFHIGGREKWHELIRTVGDGQGDIGGTSTTPIKLD